MKRFTLILLCFLMICMLTNCSSKLTVDTTNNYLYANINGIIMKYNVDSGYATPLCGDSLCEHSNYTCPFFGCGEEIYRWKHSIICYKAGDMLIYDTTTGKRQTLFSVNGEIYFPILLENKLYCDAVIYDFSPEAEHITTVNIYCYNLETDEFVKLNNEELYDIQQAEAIVDNRILWYDQGKDYSYTTNYNYEDAEKYIGEYYGIGEGEHSYRLGITSTKPTAFHLYNTENNKKNIVLDGIHSVRSYNNTLFVTKTNAEGRFIGKIQREDGSISDLYDYQGCEIYTYDNQGKNEKLLCKIPDEYILYGLSSASNTSMTLGDYMGFFIKEYKIDSKGFVTDMIYSENIVIMNYSTGEYVITRSK